MFTQNINTAQRRYRTLIAKFTREATLVNWVYLQHFGFQLWAKSSRKLVCTYDFDTFTWSYTSFHIWLVL